MFLLELDPVLATIATLNSSALRLAISPNNTWDTFSVQYFSFLSQLSPTIVDSINASSLPYVLSGLAAGTKYEVNVTVKLGRRRCNYEFDLPSQSAVSYACTGTDQIKIVYYAISSKNVNFFFHFESADNF